MDFIWSTVSVSIVTSKQPLPASQTKTTTIPYKCQLPPPRLAMPQFTKPTSMTLSEWRRWCCCYPAEKPPTSAPSERENLSLEEFDPSNRLSMSRAYERQPSAPHLPRTSRNSEDSTMPAVAARRAETHVQPLRSERPKPRNENRAGQRPTTVLLPSPPQRPPKSRGSKVVKGEQSKPQIVRENSEPWWQVGRRMLERIDREGSLRQASRERK